MAIIYNGHRISKDEYRAILVEEYLSKPSRAYKADTLLRMFAALLPGDGLSTQALVSSEMRRKAINDVDGGLEQAMFDLLEEYGKSQQYMVMLPKERFDRTLIDEEDKRLCEELPHTLRNSYKSISVPSN